MKNLRQLACKFDLNQSECKSSQVHASPGLTKSKDNPSLQLASPFGQGLSCSKIVLKLWLKLCVKCSDRA